MLAGCARIEIESEFTGDGNARHAITKVVDPGQFDDLMAWLEEEAETPDAAPDREEFNRNIASGFNTVAGQAAAAGLDVERIDEPNRIGVRVSTRAGEGEDLGRILNGLYTAITEGDEDIRAFTGSFSVDEAGENGSTYRVDLTVVGDSLLSPGALLSRGQDEDADDIFGDAFRDAIQDRLDEESADDELRELFVLSYTVSMPGELTSSNGADLGDGRVRFDLPFRGTQAFFAVSRTVDERFPLEVVVISIGALLVILIIVGAFLLLRKSR